MRKISLIILLFMIALPHCGSDETELHIDIAEHPEGGELVCPHIALW